METSQPLSIESFSYSWLVNLKPSLESLDNSLRASLDASDEASFIEMDPRMPPSKRFFRNSQDFKFDFPISQSPLTLVHADELFSNGYVMPLFVDPLKMEAYDVSDSTSALPTSSHAPKTVVSACKPQRCSSLRRCRRLSKQIVQKYLDFLRPLYRRIRGHRSSSRDENIDSKVQVMKNWVYSAETSPRISVAYSVDDCWRSSCDSESSIYEAVLHCKRSNGNSIFSPSYDYLLSIVSILLWILLYNDSRKIIRFLWHSFIYVIFREINWCRCTKELKRREGKQQCWYSHGKEKERGIKKDQQPLVSCSFLLFFWEDNVNLFSSKGVFRSCVDGRPWGREKERRI